MIRRCEVLYAALLASIYSYGQVAQRKRTLVNYSNNENYNTSIYSLLLALLALLSVVIVVVVSVVVLLLVVVVVALALAGQCIHLHVVAQLESEFLR